MLTSNKYSKMLEDNMNARLNALLEENEVVLAGLFLDPRFNFDGIEFYSASRQKKCQV